MPFFKYSFLPKKGRKKTAFIEAASLSEAKESLRQQGVLFFWIKEKGPRRSLFKGLRSHFLTQSELTVFTAQLAQLLTAKIPLYESLLSLADQNRQEAYYPLLMSLCEQIKMGIPLSKALGRFPTCFSTLYQAMVAAGESVGNLDVTLERLAQLLAKQVKIKKQITTALLYPALLCSFSIFLITLLLTFVIPSLKTVFDGHHVNRFTQLVFSLSTFITEHWMFYLPILAVTIVLTWIFLCKPKGRLFREYCLLRLPVIKTLSVQTALARFCRTMGELLQGGVPVMQALQIGRGVMHNTTLETIIVHTEKRIVEGSMLSKELSKSKWIPSLMTRMIAIGEESGSLPHMLLKIADIYDSEVEKIVTRLTALAQPVILLGMGGVVGAIMLAVLLPLTDISAFMD